MTNIVTKTTTARSLAKKVLQTEADAIIALIDRLDENFDRAVKMLMEKASLSNYDEAKKILLDQGSVKVAMDHLAAKK